MIIALTEPKPRFMLCPLSSLMEVGFDIPCKGEKSPLPLVVFFRPQFLIGTGLIRAKFIMVDCLRGLYESARSFAGMSTLFSPPPMLDIIGGGLFTLQRNTAMSHHQTASSTQATIALNPKALLNAIHWLERAKQHTSDLVDIFATHENDLKLVEIEIEITTALTVLSKAVMQGETIANHFDRAIESLGIPKHTNGFNEPTEPQATTPPKRQTTGHGLEVDGRGYDCRVLLDRDGDYLMVSQHCSKPHGHRQVCIKCGYDRFNDGVHYVKCPECEAAVNYHCRYVAIAGGV
jgi:hypothetical protein